MAEVPFVPNSVLKDPAAAPTSSRSSASPTQHVARYGASSLRALTRDLRSSPVDWDRDGLGGWSGKARQVTARVDLIEALDRKAAAGALGELADERQADARVPGLG